MLAAPAGRNVPHQPGVRNKFNYTINDVWSNSRSHLRVYILESPGKRAQDVVFYLGERVPAAFEVVVPSVVEVKRRAMINEPKLSVPYEHVRVAWCTVNVCHV